MFLSGKDLFMYKLNQIGTFALMIAIVLGMISIIMFVGIAF